MDTYICDLIKKGKLRNDLNIVPNLKFQERLTKHIYKKFKLGTPIEFLLSFRYVKNTNSHVQILHECVRHFGSLYNYYNYVQNQITQSLLQNNIVIVPVAIKIVGYNYNHTILLIFNQNILEIYNPNENSFILNNIISKIFHNYKICCSLMEQNMLLQNRESKIKHNIYEKQNGYCILWSLLVAELILKYSNISHYDIVTIISKYSDENVKHLIRGYSASYLRFFH